MNATIKQKGINNGIILGILLGLVTLLGYAVDSTIMVSYWVVLYVFFAVIILGIVTIAQAKKGLGGFINFKEAFTSYFIMLVIGLLISTLINILIFNVVDPGFKDVVKQNQISAIESQRDWAVGKMIDAGSPESEIEKMEQQMDETIEKMKNEDQYSFGKQIQGFFIGTAFFAIFGLLLALILKKKDPALE